MTFELGETGYTVDHLAVSAGGSLFFGTTAELPPSATSGLKLHVYGETFDFSGASYSGSPL